MSKFLPRTPGSGAIANLIIHDGGSYPSGTTLVLLNTDANLATAEAQIAVKVTSGTLDATDSIL
jgi:hypothetical protein